MLKFVAGQSLNPRDGEVGVKYTDAFDEISRKRIEHTTSCIPCRRLWSTLQFNRALAKTQLWSALVSEYLKLLVSSAIHCKSTRCLARFD